MADAAIDSIGRDNEIEPLFGKNVVECIRREVAFVRELDAQLATALLKDGKQAVPSDTAETMSPGTDLLADADRERIAPGTGQSLRAVRRAALVR